VYCSLTLLLRFATLHSMENTNSTYTIRDDRYSPEPDVVTLNEFRTMVTDNGWDQPDLTEDADGNLRDDNGIVLELNA
jgi:hypothetical protein